MLISFIFSSSFLSMSRYHFFIRLEFSLTNYNHLKGLLIIRRLSHRQISHSSTDMIGWSKKLSSFFLFIFCVFTGVWLLVTLLEFLRCFILYNSVDPVKIQFFQKINQSFIKLTKINPSQVDGFDVELSHIYMYIQYIGLIFSSSWFGLFTLGYL